MAEEITLLDHAKAYYKRHNLEMPSMSTDLGRKYYAEWVLWAFADMNGKNLKAKVDADQRIIEFIANQGGVL